MVPHPQLADFLAVYDPKVQETFYQLRAFILEVFPDCNELIWDNYNAVAVAYSKSDVLKDAFCHLSVYAQKVNFGFNRGVELSQQLVPLEGKGKLIRHFSVVDFNDFPKKEMEKLLLEAVGISEHRNSALLEPVLNQQSLVKSISKKKRRP